MIPLGELYLDNGKIDQSLVSFHGTVIVFSDVKELPVLRITAKDFQALIKAYQEHLLTEDTKPKKKKFVT